MDSITRPIFMGVIMDRAKILEKARAAKGPLPPSEAGEIRKNKALLWVYRWGWTTAGVLEMLVGSQRSGLGARLTKAGFLRSTKTESGSPPTFLTLTTQGRQEVEKFLKTSSDLIDYQLDPYRIDQTKMKHGISAQTSTARNLQSGGIVEYVTESMAAAKSKKNIKQHDVVWISKNGEKIGVEIELSAKWARKLDEFVLSCILSIQNKRVHRINIATDSEAIQERYEKEFEVGNKFGKWEKSASGFFTRTGEYRVPEYMEGKVSCIVVK